jgi:nicotinate-nucleotide adenylyltransferase
MRIGIFGGTFNPPHLGHLALATAALDQLALQRVLWMLTPTPPHKLNQQITSAEQRAEMVRLMLADNPAFELCMLEMQRPGPHYTVDTIALLAEQYPLDELILLIGSDSLISLPRWHQPETLLARCHQIGVMLRPAHTPDLDALEAKIPGVRAKVQLIHTPPIQFNSRDLRLALEKRQNLPTGLDARVHAYILQQGLYLPHEHSQR